MHIGTQLLQHRVYRYQGPVWVDDIDPVWIITWHRSLSHTVMIPSGLYSTLRYKQLFLVSTSKVFADMKHKRK